VDDQALTSEFVARTVVELLGDAARLQEMSVAARKLVPRDADVRLARMVLAAAGADA
jgi:UDP-N-acetylglucosamine--N-acetylmuramyl-(pentapeptide) pyrophosphoryl-undecaprenol N-acetylglucosamine transferase